MNDDEFETKLRALTGALHRSDPTPAWKADILERARRETDASSLSGTLPSRWLMLGWAAAWAAILVMELAAPSNRLLEKDRVGGALSAKSDQARVAPSDSAAPTLLAFHQRMNLNLELP